MTFATHVERCWWLLFVAAGCSLVDPQVGAAQAWCGLSTGGGSNSGPGSNYYHRNASQPSIAPTCEAQPESACNDCEAAHCCATRSACYGDPVCACADLSLDECLEAAEAGSPEDQPAAIAHCWSNFSETGTVERARVSCQRAWCQSECQIP